MVRLCAHASVLGLLLALLAAPQAQAATSWTGLPGLNAASGAQWIRDFQFASFPPTTGTTVYAATEGEGVFRSQFGGAAWQPFNSGLDDINARYVRTLLVSGTDVYAGTNLGVFKSEGGGEWKPLAQGPEENPANPRKLNESVQSLVSLPAGGPMLAGVFSGGVYRSNDDGKTWIPPAPGNGMPAHQTVTSIRSFPFLPGGPVYAASGTGIYRSFDNGATWQLRSDGIGGSPNFLWADSNRPDVMYAGTSASGMYRSINGGLTWSEINVGLLAVRTRGLEIFTASQGAVVYIATEDGLWAGRSRGNSATPPPPIWSRVTSQGLGTNTIMWALTPPALPAGQGTFGLFAGTQSNGGYFLALPAGRQPHVPRSDTTNVTTNCPRINDIAPQVGDTLDVVHNLGTGEPGSWDGTDPIDFAYQWQRCTGTTANTCTDMTNETGETYVVTEADDIANRRFRVEVTATNPAPTFQDAVRYSAISPNETGPGPNSVPCLRRSQASTWSPPARTRRPRSATSCVPMVRMSSWFDPDATSFAYQWLRCTTVLISSCRDIPGATHSATTGSSRATGRSSSGSGSRATRTGTRART